MVEKELALDRAKLRYRQEGTTFHVVNLPDGEFEVMTEAQVQDGLSNNVFNKRSIIFSLYGDTTSFED